MCDDVFITPDGVRLLGYILLSCPPEFTNGGILAKYKTLKLAERGEGIDLGELMGMFHLRNPGPNVFTHIHETAVKRGVSRADASFISWYFGGDAHIKRIIPNQSDGRLLDELNGDPRYHFKYLVSHVLMPVMVINVNVLAINGKKARCVDVLYENGDIRLASSYLIHFAKSPLRKGQIVLSHHSSIIPEEVSLDLKQMLLESQAGNRDFMEACREIAGSGIDHRKMMSFPWAKKTLDYDCS